jgi:hypothetical protein
MKLPTLLTYFSLEAVQLKETELLQIVADGFSGGGNVWNHQENVDQNIGFLLSYTEDCAILEVVGCHQNTTKKIQEIPVELTLWRAGRLPTEILLKLLTKRLVQPL